MPTPLKRKRKAGRTSAPAATTTTKTASTSASTLRPSRSSRSLRLPSSPVTTAAEPLFRRGPSSSPIDLTTTASTSPTTASTSATAAATTSATATAPSFRRPPPSSPSQFVCWVEIPPPPRRRGKTEYIFIDDDLSIARSPSKSARRPSPQVAIKPPRMSHPELDTGGFSIAKIKRAPQPPKPIVEIPVHESSDDQGPCASKSQSRKDSSRHPSKKPPTSSSSSKRKAAPSSSSSSTHKGKSKSKHRAEGGASQRLDREGRSKKKKQRRHRASRGSEPDDSDDGDDVSNLKSYLNDDALARSSGSTHKADFRKHLEKMRKDRERLRRRRKLLGSEDDDDDDTASGSDDDSDDDDDDSDASGHTSLFGSSVSGSDGERRRRSSATKAKARAKGKDKERHKGSSAPRTSSKAPRINDAVDDQSSTPSEWSSEIEDASSDTGSDNGASSDPEDFIVGDDLVETEDGKKIRTSKADAAKGSGSRRRLHLAGGLGSGGGGVLAAFGLGHARLEFEDLCGLWIEWAVVRMLIPFGNVSAEDRERLERGRGQLRNKMRSAEEALTSSAMRRQFSWYLREYPKVTIKLVFDDEIRKIGGLAKRGCGACHRRNQACSHLVRFEGRRYDQETLGKREPRSDDDSSSESDRSADGENLAESDVDDKNRRAKRFYVGTHCASRASAMHAIHHWEWAVMQGLNRHPAVQRVRDDVEARGGVGIDGSEGPGAEDVELCVREMSDDHAPGGGERQKLVRKLKKLLAEADTVNRLQ